MSEHSCVYPVHMYIFNLFEVEKYSSKEQKECLYKTFCRTVLNFLGLSDSVFM